MKRILHFYFLILLIGFNSPIFSQQYFNFIKGKIIDTENKQPLAGVTLQLRFGLDIYTARTDASGNYAIKTTARYIDGEYEINVFHQDYYELNGVILVKDNVERDFGLKRKKALITAIDTVISIVSLDGFASNNWTLLVDMSSSMGEQNILTIMKSGLENIIQYFRSEDKITILTFSSKINEILPPTSGNNKDKINQAVEQLKKVGGTSNGADAIGFAFKRATENYIENGNNRILIFTDGMFTSGSKEYKSIEKTIKSYAQKNINSSIFLLGTPTPYVINNLKHLAEIGEGTFATLQDEATAKQKMLEEAKQVKK